MRAEHQHLDQLRAAHRSSKAHASLGAPRLSGVESTPCQARSRFHIRVTREETIMRRISMLMLGLALFGFETTRLALGDQMPGRATAMAEEQIQTRFQS